MMKSIIGSSCIISNSNSDSIKDTTGGTITVNEGTFTGVGNIDLKNLTGFTLVGSNPGFTSATTITFTVTGTDINDQVFSTETFSIDVKWPVYAGHSSSKLVSNLGDLGGLQKKLTLNSPDGLEFSVNPGGAQKYFSVLVPNEIATGECLLYPRQSVGYD